MSAQTEVALEGPLGIKRTRYGDDVLVFALTGELDLSVADAARDVLGVRVEDFGGLLVLDLTHLEFIDSSGIALIYELARARPDPASLRLLPSRHGGVNRLLKLTAVDSVITIAPS